MFGMSFGEIAVIVIFGLIVMGPKELPKVLRKLGQWAAKLRRMAGDLRAQSGIDDVLAEGGIGEDLNEIRKLARGEIEGVRRLARIEPRTAPIASAAAKEPTREEREIRATYAPTADPVYIAREREYPREGADSYGALPDTALVYPDTFPKSALFEDALYMTGDANAKLDYVAPPPPPAEKAPAASDEADEEPAQGEPRAAVSS